MFDTQTKNNAKVIGLKGLKEISDIANCEVVAIGGIDGENFQEVYDAGADRLAVCSAVLESENPEEIAKLLRGK